MGDPAAELPDHLRGLNEAQLEGATTLDGPVLVLAGAGTGKTRLLTARVVHLLKTGRTRARNLLVCTFTTKAAGEMRERIARARPNADPPRWLGTFHSIARRLLAEAPQVAGLKDGFAVADEDDTRRIIRAILKMRGIKADPSDQGDIAKAVQKELGRFKVKGLVPAAAQDHVRQLASQAAEALAEACRQDGGDDADPAPADGTGLLDAALTLAADIYPTYQETLRASNQADFGDLLLWPTLAMEEDEDLRRRWASKFTHALVDEYQDTNRLQVRFLRSLVRDHGNVFAVGDDDQTIFSFNLALVENILEFEKDFPAAKVIRLVENYRCSATILAAANAVIANNRSRRGKTLVATRPDGERITVADCADDWAEAGMIARAIEREAADGCPLNEIMVLVRVTWLSRAIEEALLKAKIPHEVVGQVGFWSREEVRDGVAFLKLVFRPQDHAAFERVANKPSRGIGARAMEKILAHAQANHVTPMAAAQALADAGEFRADTAAGVRALAAVVQAIRAAPTRPDVALVALLEAVGYRQWLIARAAAGEAPTAEPEAGESAGDDPVPAGTGTGPEGGGGRHHTADNAEVAERLENLDEMVHAASKWPDALSFLDHVDQIEANADAAHKSNGRQRVRIMTIHRAKGLEADVVFSPAWEEGILPHARALAELDEKRRERQVEEERRLAYVDLTRARRRQVLSRARIRRDETLPSRFLGEIPEELLERIDVDLPPQPPTDKMLRFAGVIARVLQLALPPDIEVDGRICAEFLDMHKPAYLARLGADQPQEARRPVSVADDEPRAEHQPAADRQQPGLRLLACGGRDFADRELVFATLDAIHAATPVAVLIHGAARGADRLAGQWAIERGVEAEAYPAEWDRLGLAAGMIRNRVMLKEGKPDLVVAFPGGAGTRAMAEIAEAAGVETRRVGW